MKYLDYLYMLLCVPSYILFRIIARKDERIREDFIVNRKFHSKSHMNEYVAFCYMMQRLPEYRFVLYNRMSVFAGFILGIFLPKRRIYFNIRNLLGGCKSCMVGLQLFMQNKWGGTFLYTKIVQ